MKVLCAHLHKYFQDFGWENPRFDKVKYENIDESKWKDLYVRWTEKLKQQPKKYKIDNGGKLVFKRDGKTLIEDENGRALKLTNIMAHNYIDHDLVTLREAFLETEENRNQARFKFPEDNLEHEVLFVFSLILKYFGVDGSREEFEDVNKQFEDVLNKELNRDLSDYQFESDLA